VTPVQAGRRISRSSVETPGQFAEVAQVALPPTSDPAASILLTVNAFDDKLRASMGDTFVEFEP